MPISKNNQLSVKSIYMNSTIWKLSSSIFDNSITSLNYDDFTDFDPDSDAFEGFIATNLTMAVVAKATTWMLHEEHVPFLGVKLPSQMQECSIFQSSKPKKVAQVSSLVETNIHSFTYKALKKATHDFNEEVGKGSFGIVYKGTLRSITNNVVAVKRLDRLVQEREKEFMNELSVIRKSCHKNLVQLIGFCDEGVHRLLVYEFMSNDTLADILFGNLKPNWDLRVNFALGIVRGLLYLHEECEAPIIHYDIKPQNILIDGNFVPKISNFGLEKLMYSNKSQTHTMMKGTKGYVAPEWFKNVPVTAKVDVYNYGVMLLEIICNRRSVKMDIEKGKEEEEILIG
ncbi:G-type lectin S-receptor-like serine/threonine-protein kinase LECRK1 [Prosopis cineraria]|uniref:G-type lectin S-receptor-like serine/threonine-protein kinase LECRK1 n=1 Tax=Prosopis cineraria TaxID=364024 RepID=UPI0024105F24|nr:G-type lectin S-receptor-like serine/threonine-protein kinase LECRK1 [Prosopis cineraria]